MGCLSEIVVTLRLTLQVLSAAGHVLGGCKIWVGHGCWKLTIVFLVFTLKVLSAAGHVLGERKIRVGRGRVELIGIAVRVVSGLSLQIAKHRHLPGALTATAVLDNKLVARQQVSA